MTNDYIKILKSAIFTYVLCTLLSLESFAIQTFHTVKKEINQLYFIVVFFYKGEQTDFGWYPSMAISFYALAENQ
jgi:hypothetical protein